MGDILELLKNASPLMILLVFLLYFFTLYIQKIIQRMGERTEEQIREISQTSLAIKKDLRGEERGILVEFRVAVEEWEDFLQTAVFEFTMMDPLKADVRELAEDDRRLFRAVKIANVKACTYLRNQDLEKQLGDIILKIRNIYYPIINKAMPKLIDVQAELMLIQNKRDTFQPSGVQDMSLAPTEKDREKQLKLQTMMTAELKEFSENLINQYRSIAEVMAELKEEINHYIYRPIEKTDIDKA